MKLNVVLITYNHSNYIEETLQSIIMQKTDFDFDIIIADDKSTDDTLDRIKSCEKTCSIPFRYLESAKNLGITKNYQRAFYACNAPYVAVMEGDDIWTDPRRLQKHIDFLDNHYECAMSFNRYIVSNFEKANCHIQPTWGASGGYQLITSRDIIQDNFIGNFSTCVYRKKALDNLPAELFNIVAYDWITNIMVGRMGMIGYLTDVMSIYRLHSNGVWSGQKEVDNLKETIAAIDIYNDFTDRLYNEEFTEHKRMLRERLATTSTLNIDHSKKVKIKRIFKQIKNYSPPIIIWIIKAIIPEKLWNKIK